MARQRYALPPGLLYFRHPVAWISYRIIDEEIPPNPSFAVCESPRGQAVCSCGRFALAWDDSGVETIFT